MAEKISSLTDSVRFSPRGVYAPTITVFESHEEEKRNELTRTTSPTLALSNHCCN
jgi:hypothetical protein